MQHILFPQHLQVYKSFPFYPSNGTFDPQLSFNQQDVDFLVENGFNIVRLYVAWQGVEFSKGQYNLTYLKVRKCGLDRIFFSHTSFLHFIGSGGYCQYVGSCRNLYYTRLPPRCFFSEILWYC